LNFEVTNTSASGGWRHNGGRFGTVACPFETQDRHLYSEAGH
jgi:hypothetical protein